MTRGWHPPHVLDRLPAPAPRLVEHHAVPRRWTASWYDPPFVPDLEYVDQVYGICFDDAGSILLVRTHDEHGGSPYWNLAGGGLEEGESFEQCLAREVAEEACADVVAARYLGCQRVDELAGEIAVRSCFQLRYWARIRLRDWDPEHETLERRLVPSSEFLDVLAWGAAQTARVVLDEGLLADQAAGRTGIGGG